jgi:hypothetical protein
MFNVNSTAVRKRHRQIKLFFLLILGVLPGAITPPIEGDKMIKALLRLK